MPRRGWPRSSGHGRREFVAGTNVLSSGSSGDAPTMAHFRPRILTLRACRLRVASSDNENRTMRLTESRRQAVASNAIAHVVQSAILEIRTMAFRREPLLSEIFPGVDYQEQIRLIARCLRHAGAGPTERRERNPLRRSSTPGKAEMRTSDDGCEIPSPAHTSTSCDSFDDSDGGSR